MAEKDQKTEQPTQRRVQKAREEGNFASARVFVGAVQFLTFVFMFHSWGRTWIDGIHTAFDVLLRHALMPTLSTASLVDTSLALLKRVLTPLTIQGAVLLAATLAAQLLVTGLGVSLKKLSPDPKRLNPLARIKELPKQNLPSLAQAVVMLPVFGWTVYALVKSDYQSFLALPLDNLMVGAMKVGSSIEALLWKASLVFMAFGAVDLFRQKRRYQQELRMSKQEIRDEMKEVEGNPLMKSRIRRLRRDLARRNMMREIPTATAVVVNPTHYAVALNYSVHSPGAPRVVAKGKNYLALRIRQKALDHNVPLIENPPLARALYQSVEVGQEIPAEFYRAVAEILAYIFRLMNGKMIA